MERSYPTPIIDRTVKKYIGSNPKKLYVFYALLGRCLNVKDEWGIHLHVYGRMRYDIHTILNTCIFSMFNPEQVAMITAFGMDDVYESSIAFCTGMYFDGNVRFIDIANNCKGKAVVFMTYDGPPESCKENLMSFALSSQTDRAHDFLEESDIVNERENLIKKGEHAYERLRDISTEKQGIISLFHREGIINSG
ncbi:hypothetical protein TetV_603 [Tetraselmis virus 1]|uniref:Uncharacterized protein n=1 Tax=Tetraselmis virus 1 TaxID=2060617 RepID=A0A2P0VP55_9VIRU|nr:hypothetical protein QJ968_gp451 [Tetraselmis virus 1]AUF82685.1 hypothetical protein TetV_603 [Tetraselmis virus 1]